MNVSVRAEHWWPASADLVDLSHRIEINLSRGTEKKARTFLGPGFCLAHALWRVSGRSLAAPEKRLRSG